MQTEVLKQNTWWRPIYWEPVDGSGERLMVAVIVERDGEMHARQTIRDDLLDCLYGKAAAGPRNLIRTALDLYLKIGSVREAEFPCFGMTPGPLRHTWADSVAGACRQAVELYSSLGSPNKLDEMEESDAPSQEESNRRFSTEVRAGVIAFRPELEPYFGRSAVLLEGGEPVRFGYCSPRAIVHFGVLSPVRQSGGVRDARARLWELNAARELARLPSAALLMAVPRADDPTLSTRQSDAARRNVAEIEREADKFDMRFLPVHSVDAGVDRLLELAA